MPPAASLRERFGRTTLWGMTLRHAVHRSTVSKPSESCAMTEVKNHFRVFLVVVGLSSTASFLTVEAQVPPSQQAHTSTSVLGMTISSGWTTNTTLPGHIALIRKMGVPIGLEIDHPSGFNEQIAAYDLALITITNDTVSSALKKITGQYNEYTWQFDSGLSYADVYPKIGALCVASVPPCSITSHSLMWVFSSDLPTLKGLKIGLVEPWSRGRPVNQDLFVDLEFKGGILMEFLNRLALALGDKVSWELDVRYGYPTLRFSFPHGVQALPSYRPPERQTLPPSHSPPP